MGWLGLIDQVFVPFDSFLHLKKFTINLGHRSLHRLVNTQAHRFKLHLNVLLREGDILPALLCNLVQNCISLLLILEGHLCKLLQQLLHCLQTAHCFNLRVF